MPMNKHQLTVYQAIFCIVLFNFGSSVVMGISTGVGQDTLLALLAAALAVVPLYWMYARILTLFPGKNLFEILQLLFGSFAGKAMTALLVWYCIHLAALVMRNFSEFTQVSTMPETPQLPIALLLGLTTVYLARSNIRAIGKWSVVGFFLVIFVVLLTFTAALREIRLEDILPLMEYPVSKIAPISFQVFSFPYAEAVIFLCVGCCFPTEKQNRIFLQALGIILTIFLLVFVRNLVLLGRKMMEVNYFPSYVAVRIIELGDFLARFEGLISSNFLLAGILKISVCLLAAAKGLSVLFGFNRHRLMVMPAGILAMGICAIVYKNMMDMFLFLKYYPYYAFPFQVLIPLLVWVVGELRRRGRESPAPDAPQA